MPSCAPPGTTADHGLPNARLADPPASLSGRMRTSSSPQRDAVEPALPQRPVEPARLPVVLGVAPVLVSAVLLLALLEAR